MQELSAANHRLVRPNQCNKNGVGWREKLNVRSLARKEKQRRTLGRWRGGKPVPLLGRASQPLERRY